jgi:TrmH family RNA methyltransferase
LDHNFSARILSGQNTVQITSLHNPRVKAAARLRERSGRDEQRRIFIDGLREITRAVEAGLEVIEVYFLADLCRDEEHLQLLAEAKQRRIELIEVTPHIMEKLAFGQRVEGMVAVARSPRRGLADLRLGEVALVAIVEGAEKPGNLGAILRTADAAGVSAVIVADGATDLYNPNAIRASLGAIFTVPVCAAKSDEVLAWLRQARFRLFAARVDGAIDYAATDFRGRAAIALGSEAYGLSAIWRASDITAIRLPILGRVDSLNLSVTAAVLFYEALRQRTTPPNPEP